MKDEILLECIDCKECYVGDKSRDGYSCPKCGGMIIPLGYIEEHKKHIEEAAKRIRRAILNGNIKEAAKREKLQHNHNHVMYGVDFGTGKDLTVKVKIDTEQLCRDIERLIKTIEEFPKKGVTI